MGVGRSTAELPGQLELAVAGGQEEDLEPGAFSGPGGGGGCSESSGSAGGGGFSAKQVSETETPQRRRQQPGPRYRVNAGNLEKHFIQIERLGFLFSFPDVLSHLHT